MDTNEVTRRLDRIIELLEALTATGQVPTTASTQAQGTAAHLPTFAGFNCSWQKNDRGLPAYLVDPDTGELAQRTERQGDVWWSYTDETHPSGFRRLAELKAGDQMPAEAQWKPPAAPKLPPRENQAQPRTEALTAPATPENGPPPAGSQPPPPENRPPEPSERPGNAQAQAAAKAQEAAAKPQPQAPDDENPFTTLSQGTLRRLHALGRAVHGEQWREIGPERVTAHSDGRAERSDQLSHDEAIRLINELQAEIQARKQSPEYAG